jgi:hypothetical protein
MTCKWPRVSSVHRSGEVTHRGYHPSEPGYGVQVAELLELAQNVQRVTCHASDTEARHTNPSAHSTFWEPDMASPGAISMPGYRGRMCYTCKFG